MTNNFRIKKGLNIKLVGEADKITKEATPSKVYTIQLDDFHGLVPKLIAKQGHEVKAGDALFYSKENPNVKVASPMSGEVIEIVRGEKRRILEIKILADAKVRFKENNSIDYKSVELDELKNYFSENGLWPFIKQRPFDVIANPEDKPKAIFISATPTAPLSPDMDYILNDKKKEIQTAIDALKRFTDGDIHIGLRSDSTVSLFNELNNCKVHTFKGPHPVGNLSVQIAKISPINKGEVVWTVNPDDLAIIGTQLLTGEFHAERTVAITGSEVNNPHYVKMTIGAKLEDVLQGEVDFEGNNRIISGNVLTGNARGKEQAVGYFDNQITVIEEGDDYDFFGWNRPRPNKFSLLRANMFSFLTPNKKYKLNTSTNGEHRAFVLTGHYEKVFPLDIYPMNLLKSIMYQDIDEMEKLGIYEVAPEDFALTEFICPSKMNHQEIVREGLDLMIKELG